MAVEGTRRAGGVLIRVASATDADAIWQIIKPAIREGETYTIDPDISREDALAYWFDSPQFCFIAEAEGNALGTYYLKPNQSGGGRHVCNTGYMVSVDARRQGVARAMCEHSKTEARAAGYRAIQFNFVVSTNTGAIDLWQELGFSIVGRLPSAFDSPSAGYVDALVMFQTL